MSNIPEIPKNDLLKKLFQNTSKSINGYQASSKESSPTPTISPLKDTVSFSSLKTWIKMLEDMPEPKLSQEELDAINEGLQNMDQETLRNTIAPKIASDVLTDWGVN